MELSGTPLKTYIVVALQLSFEKDSNPKKIKDNNPNLFKFCKMIKSIDVSILGRGKRIMTKKLRCSVLIHQRNVLLCELTKTADSSVQQAIEKETSASCPLHCSGYWASGSITCDSRKAIRRH